MTTQDPLDPLRIEAATYAEHATPKPFFMALSWVLVATFVNTMFLSMAWLSTTALASVLGYAITGDHPYPTWFIYTSFAALCGPLAWITARAIKNTTITARDDRLGRRFQYTFLTILRTALPDHFTWLISSPKSAYTPQHWGHEFIGFPTQPDIPLAAVGGWSVSCVPFDIRLDDGGYPVTIHLHAENGVCELSVSVRIPKDDTTLQPPCLDRAGVETHTEEYESYTQYRASFIDHDRVFAGFLQPRSRIEYKRALQRMVAWSREATRILEPTLKTGEGMRWSTQTPSIYEGNPPPPTPPPELAKASRSTSHPPHARAWREHPTHRVRRNRVRFMKVVDVLGGLMTVSVGVALGHRAFSTEFAHMFHVPWTVWYGGMFEAVGPALFALISWYVARRAVLNWEHHMYTWAFDPLDEPKVHETILTLQGSTLTSQDGEIDLARPFQWSCTQSDTDGDTFLLGVTITQNTERVVFRVPLRSSSWSQGLAHLDLRSPVVHGRDFDAWILPTLVWYSAIHGDAGSSHLVHNTAKATAQRF